MKVSGKQYVVLFGASIGSLFAGSSFMHAILKPDLTIPDLSGPAPPASPQAKDAPARGSSDEKAA